MFIWLLRSSMLIWLLIMLSCNYMASYHSHFQYVQRLYVSLGIIHSSNMYQYKTRCIWSVPKTNSKNNQKSSFLISGPGMNMKQL